MDKKKIIKIAVPVLIAVVLAALWIVKAQSPPTVIDNNPVNNADFALISSSIDLEALTAYGLPIIIDFGADSCVPCREMAPALVAVNAAMQGKAIVKFVDVSKYPKAADGFPIQVIPTQVFIGADGKPYVPVNDLGVQFSLYSYKENNEHAFTVHQGGLTEKQMLAILKEMGVE